MGLQMFKHLSRLNPVFTAIFERESNRFLSMLRTPTFHELRNNSWKKCDRTIRLDVMDRELRDMTQESVIRM